MRFMRPPLAYGRYEFLKRFPAPTPARAKLVALQFRANSRGARAGRGAFNRQISIPANWPINYCRHIADLLPASLSMRATAHSFSIFSSIPLSLSLSLSLSFSICFFSVAQTPFQMGAKPTSGTACLLSFCLFMYFPRSAPPPPRPPPLFLSSYSAIVLLIARGAPRGMKFARQGDNGTR